MRRMFFLVPLLCAPLLANAAPVASVNGHLLSQELMQSMDPNAINNPAAWKQTLEQLVSRDLLAQQANLDGWNNEAKVQAQLQLSRMQILARIAAEKYFVKHPINPEQLQKSYQQFLASLPPKEYRFRDILVNSRKRAEVLLQDLQKGESFSKLANQYSQSRNAALGGENGWVPQNKLPAQFLTVLEQGKEGEVFGPIVIPSGWAIIQKQGEQPTPKPSLTEIRNSLIDHLRNQQLQVYLQELRKKAKINIYPEAVGGKNHETPIYSQSSHADFLDGH